MKMRALVAIDHMTMHQEKGTGAGDNIPEIYGAYELVLKSTDRL